MNEHGYPVPGSSGESAPVPATRALERSTMRGVVSILGNKGIKGPWTMPAQLRVLSILGEARVDLRDARLESDVSVIEVLAIMGTVVITVPPDVVVECDGEQFLGSFEVRRRKSVEGVEPPPGAPRIRIVGHAYAGNAHVVVKRRGER